MQICVKCQKEMRCQEIGILAHYGHGHVYPGDTFACPVCGAVVLVTNPTPCHVGVEILEKQTVIDMTSKEVKVPEEVETPEPRLHELHRRLMERQNVYNQDSGGYTGDDALILEGYQHELTAILEIIEEYIT